MIKSATLHVQPSGSRAFGRFVISVAARRSGRVSILVTHAATSAMRAFAAKRSYASLSENVGFGSTGPFVQLIQQRLAALHVYVIRSGVYDQHTGLAVDAYHRLLRRGHSQSLDGRAIRPVVLGDPAEAGPHLHVEAPEGAVGHLDEQVGTAPELNGVGPVTPIAPNEAGLHSSGPP